MIVRLHKKFAVPLVKRRMKFYIIFSVYLTECTSAGNWQGAGGFSVLYPILLRIDKFLQQKNPTTSQSKSLDLWSEWRESNSRPLEPHCAPLVDMLVKTAHNIRYITNFRIRFFILFRLMSRRFIPFVVKLWSNDPDK